MLTGYWAWLLASGHLTWHPLQIPKWIYCVWGLSKFYPYFVTSAFLYLCSGVVTLHCPINRWGTTDVFSQMVMIIQEMTSQEWIESFLGWALSVLWRIFLLLQMLHGHIMINWSASLYTSDSQGFMSLLLSTSCLVYFGLACFRPPSLSSSVPYNPDLIWTLHLALKCFGIQVLRRYPIFPVSGFQFNLLVNS